MKKICKPITYCSPGEILAEDINNKKGTVLLVKNTMINDFIKEKLSGLGIQEIRIYEQQEKIQNREDILNYNKIKQDYTVMLKAVKYILQKLTKDSLDYKDVSIVTEEMFSYMNDTNSIIQCLSNVRNKDEYTYQHSINVALYAMLTAKWLELPEYMTKEIIQAGLLHDIGKVKIPMSILNKQGKLSCEEYEIIKNHPKLGHDMIQDIPELDGDIAKAVLQHHERIDGSGYPSHLAYSDIGLYGKIIAICDVFDAMTQNRVYKSRVTPFDTFQMFLTNGLCTFDVHILSTFLKHISPYYIGSQVMLNNGQQGQIVYIPPQDILYPIIQIEKEYIDLSKDSNLKILELI